MALDADDLEALRAACGVPAPVVPAPARFDWSAPRVALLRQRWAEGLSASSIAKELGSGISRCAVLGKVHRLKLMQPEFRRQHPRKEHPRKRPRAPRPVARPRGRGPSQLMEMLCALGLDAVFGAPDTRTLHRHAGRAFGPGVGLLDLTAATCRWPVGEPGEESFAFCGATPLKPYPYCVGHCLIAYRPDGRRGDESKPRPVAEPARAPGGRERAA